MAARPEPRPGVMTIEAYVPGKSAASGMGKVHKLSSNETPLGPSPKAIEAIRPFDHLELYPGRVGDPPARGDRRQIRPGSRPHHVRLGLGRNAVADHHHLSGSGRRGDLHRARVPGL